MGKTNMTDKQYNTNSCFLHVTIKPRNCERRTDKADVVDWLLVLALDRLDMRRRGGDPSQIKRVLANWRLGGWLQAHTQSLSSSFVWPESDRKRAQEKR